MTILLLHLQNPDLISIQEALGLDILLKAHLDEHEKSRVQLSTLSRVLFYCSGVTTASKLRQIERSSLHIESPAEVRLCEGNSAQTIMSRGRLEVLPTRPSGLSLRIATGEKGGHDKDLDDADLTYTLASNASKRQFKADTVQVPQLLNGTNSRPPSKSPSLPPYAEKTVPPDLAALRTAETHSGKRPNASNWLSVPHSYAPRSFSSPSTRKPS